MQNDIENILNEIASKDSQVLCREVPYLAFKTYFLHFLLPNLWTSVRVQLIFVASRKALGESPVSRLKYLPKN